MTTINEMAITVQKGVLEIIRLREINKELLRALRQISTIVEGSKAQMENQIRFARSTAEQAIRKVEEKNA